MVVIYSVVGILQANDLMCSDSISDHDRFGGVQGAERDVVIKNMYEAVDHAWSRKVIPFYNAGRRMVFKHSENQRNNQAHLSKLGEQHQGQWDSLERAGRGVADR